METHQVFYSPDLEMELLPLLMLHRPKQITISRTKANRHEKYTPHFLERSGNMQNKNGKEKKERRKKISRKGQRIEAKKMTLHITDGLQ